MLWDPKNDRSAASLALLAAADYIDQHGWCQNQLKAKDGRVCVLGAFREVLGEGYLYNKSLYGLSRNSDVFFGAPFLADWNDAPGRTKEQVVNKLREIASLMENDNGL